VQKPKLTIRQRLRRLWERWRQHRFEQNVALGGCERCASFYPTTMQASRTAYAWNGEGKDPNLPLRLCTDCAVDHHAYWDERWDDYWRGCL
jgi:hypothetical protein